MRRFRHWIIRKAAGKEQVALNLLVDGTIVLDGPALIRNCAFSNPGDGHDFIVVKDGRAEDVITCVD